MARSALVLFSLLLTGACKQNGKLSTEPEVREDCPQGLSLPPRPGAANLLLQAASCVVFSLKPQCPKHRSPHNYGNLRHKTCGSKYEGLMVFFLIPGSSFYSGVCFYTHLLVSV